MGDKHLGRLSFEKKKKVVNFHNWGGGSSQKFDIFTTFFFACSNSSKSAIKFFCKGGRGTPWPIYFENLDDYQLNIDFFQSFFLGFQGRIFPILHIMVFWSWSKQAQKLGKDASENQNILDKIRLGSLKIKK